MTEQAELYLYTIELLEQYGYMQYEIQILQKKGFESRHNSSYWECGEYIGIGPSAHSFFNGKRFFYDRSIENFKANKIINDGEGRHCRRIYYAVFAIEKGTRYRRICQKIRYSVAAEFFQKN